MVELEALQENLDEFKIRRASVVALCPQRQEYNQNVMADLQLGFPIVQDPDNKVATTFGLTLETPADVIEAEKFLGLDLPAHNGNDNWDLPMPARYVLNHDSEILYASIHVDHRMRSHPRECLDSLN